MFAANPQTSVTSSQAAGSASPSIDPKSDFSSSNFTINVWGLSPGGKNVKDALGWGEAKNKATNILQVIISVLILPFGVLAIFTMTVWGGMMIFSGGKDEVLNRGKWLFMGSLVALSVALLSGFIMNLLSKLLFK